jgi:NitT/TauT family transport system ATP-binding protein
MVAVVDVEDVNFTYDTDGRSVNALAGVSFSIDTAEFVAVVGPSGCGKSTLLRAINGLIPLSDGRIDWGTDEDLKGGRLRSAIVFQSSRLLPWRTVIENVGFGLECLGIPRSEAVKRGRVLLEVVGVADFADAYPRQLSGGMQQRVNLARALAVDPGLILMDEPFAALDAQTRELMQEYLSRMWFGQDKAALLVTHQVDEAIYLADRVLVFSARPGRILADIKVPFERPRSLDIKRSPEFLETEEYIWSLLKEPSPAAQV